jgi:hypothetical protein
MLAFRMPHDLPGGLSTPGSSEKLAPSASLAQENARTGPFREDRRANSGVALADTPSRPKEKEPRRAMQGAVPSPLPPPALHWRHACDLAATVAGI